MKIRIKGDSVRLRLTRTDIQNIGSRGWVAEKTQFSNSTFFYRLQRSTVHSSLAATFSESTITVFIPEDFVTELVSTDRVGYDTHMPVGNGNTLFILVEKDFQCLDHTLEDQSDMYVNPNKTC